MVFYPNHTDDATLVASSQESGTVVSNDWERANQDDINSRRERDMRALGFGNRSSHCG